jgi:Ferritin-like domain
MDSLDTSTADTDVLADAASSSGLRRRLLGAGLIGLAGSLLPGLASRAGASPDQSPDQSTTTAPPRQPDSADIAQLSFAQTIELAARQLYSAALATDGLGDTTRAVIAEVSAAHLAYSQSLGALIGRTFPGEPLQSLVDEGAAAFSGSQADIVAAAAELENVLVATLTEMVGVMNSINGARLLSSMLIAESRHALVFADLAGRTELDDLLVDSALALTPEEG